MTGQTQVKAGVAVRKFINGETQGVNEGTKYEGEDEAQSRHWRYRYTSARSNPDRAWNISRLEGHEGGREASWARWEENL